MMDYKPLNYEVLWRPNYEGHAVLAWMSSAGIAGGVSYLGSMPPEPLFWMAGICGGMAMARIPKAIMLHRFHRNLYGRDLEFINQEKLALVVDKSKERLWLGKGFEWERRHAQRVFEILKRDLSDFRSPKTKDGERIGQPWIHGIEPKEEEITQPLEHSEGHTLIAGTTGSGKTRLFDLLISQAIYRHETTIIVDPKGDKEMRENAQRACEAMGRPEDFVFFHPAFPEESARLDLLANFTRVTEIASRIAAVTPSESGSDPFKAFGWQGLNNVSQGLHIAHEKPTLVLLRRFLEGGAASLVIKAIEAYAESKYPNWAADAEPYTSKAIGGSSAKKAAALMRFYYEKVQPEYPHSGIEGLLSMFQHDQAHFAKMIASLLPTLNMLTSGDMGPLLSPIASDINDPRRIVDNKSVIAKKMVAYIGLDSLTDNMVASAVGSLYMSDLTAVAGDRYNFGVNNEVVNVFVDEAAEVLNDPFIQLLNKGRGAGIRLFIATQTFSDFVARLGGKDKALQVLGNINNLISLRVIDSETQEFIASSLPETRLNYVMRTQGQNTHGEQPIMHGGNQGERLMEEASPLFPPQLLGMLPNLEYIGKISGGRIIKGRVPILVENKL